MRRSLLLAAIALLATTAPSASAETPAGTDVPTGRCRMTLNDRGATIQVHYVLRTNRPHREWKLAVFDQGERVFRRRYETNASGALRAWIRIPDPGGFRKYVGRATDLLSKAHCTVVVRG